MAKSPSATWQVWTGVPLHRHRQLHPIGLLTLFVLGAALISPVSAEPPVPTFWDEASIDADVVRAALTCEPAGESGKSVICGGTRHLVVRRSVFEGQCSYPVPVRGRQSFVRPNGERVQILSRAAIKRLPPSAGPRQLLEWLSLNLEWIDDAKVLVRLQGGVMDRGDPTRIMGVGCGSSDYVIEKRGGRWVCSDEDPEGELDSSEDEDSAEGAAPAMDRTRGNYRDPCLNER